MTIIKRSERARPCIDLQGPDGNAFVLCGYAQKYGKALGKTKDEISAITTEMRSGTYDNLVEVFEREFGEYVDIILVERHG